MRTTPRKGQQLWRHTAAKLAAAIKERRSDSFYVACFAFHASVIDPELCCLRLTKLQRDAAVIRERKVYVAT